MGDGTMTGNISSKKLIKKEYTEGIPGHVLDEEYFYYETAPDYNKELAIVCGGYEKCAPDFKIKRANYPYYFIKYTTTGKGTLKISRCEHRLERGTLSGFSPGVLLCFLSLVRISRHNRF